MVRSGWILKRIASGNLAVFAFDDENEYDLIEKLKETLDELYGEKVRYMEPHEVLIMMDEWFQEVYIEDVHFNIGDEYGITSFMTYDDAGNQYIIEIAKKLNAVVDNII